MKPKQLYLILCVLGFLLPYSQFVPWIAAHGLDPVLFVRELLATRIGAFFAMDVIVSAIVLIPGSESRTNGVRFRIAGHRSRRRCWWE